jgi:hypothetical protein
MELAEKLTLECVSHEKFLGNGNDVEKQSVDQRHIRYCHDF